MRILHISDLHFKATKKPNASQSLLIDRLVERLKNVGPIDLIFFTGDLVFSGFEKNDFINAKSAFLTQISKTLNLTRKNIIMCPGNHDVDRAKISPSIQNFIRGIKSNDEIEKFIKNKDDFANSLKPTLNYYEFQKEFYKEGVLANTDILTPLYSIHKRDLQNGQSIGIATINTAWCSFDDNDSGNLYFPISEMHRAIEKLKDYKWKAILLHHPLSDLRSFNKFEIEDEIYNTFHFLFSGHIHKRDDYFKLTFNEGIFGTHAEASNTTKDDGRIGFSIIDFDFKVCLLELKKYNYDFTEKIFIEYPPTQYEFPVNEKKSKQIKIYKTIKKRLIETSESANDLFVNNHNTENSNFLKLFVTPVLKKYADIEIRTKIQLDDRYKFTNLFTDQKYIIYGKDKTGKTSLLYKVKIELLNNYSSNRIIPFYIDLKSFENDENKLDFYKLFGKFIELSAASTKEILSTYKIKLLLDNFNPSKDIIKQKIATFLSENISCSYILIADQTLSSSYEKFDFGFDGYEQLFIHDISRPEIRELTNKWTEIPVAKKEEFIDKIVEVLKQNGIPFNFWTLSIFLWIFSSKKNLNFSNNSEMIELYVDDLLDRAGLASNLQNRFSYNNYKLLLSELAIHLLKEKKSTNHAISFSELCTFIDKFLKANDRRVGTVSDIVDYLINKGILKKIENDLVTFRLNGVFEYFMAFYFMENKEFLYSLVNDDVLYLSFKNEFELYSGFTKNATESQEFLNKIFEKTLLAFKELMKILIQILTIN